MVDTECYQGEHEEEDDDYYRDDVVLFDHFGGLVCFLLLSGLRGGRVRCVGGVDGRLVGGR